MPPPLASRLQVKHLRLIATVAELEQISLAAQALGMTQPAASRALSGLEAMVGAPLFDRHPRGMALTPVGEGLVRHARNVLDEMAAAAAELERLRAGTGGVVRIGAVTGAAVGYVVPVIRALKLAVPEVEMHIDVATSEELVRGLVGMRYDMVMARLPPDAAAEDFTLMPAAAEVVDLITSRRSPLAERGRLALAELSSAAWVIQSPGAPIRRAVEEAFLAAEAPVPVNVTNTASLLVMLSLIREGQAITPVAQEVAAMLRATQPEIVTLPIRETITVGPYALITRRGRRLSPAAARCRGLLGELIRARRAEAPPTAG